MTTIIRPAMTGPAGAPALTPARRVALVIGTLVSLVTIAFGTTWVVAEGTRTTERLVFTIDPVGDRFSVFTDTGNITVTASPDDKVHVTRLSEFGTSRPVYTEVPDGSGDRVSADCTGGWLSSECTVDYQVAVPARLSVQLRTNTGDVRAGELDGEVDAESGTGDVVARRVTGPLRLRSSTGDVSAEAARADRVTAESSTGDVELRFAEAPDAVTATTNTGDVRLWLPTGPYAVDATTDTGETRVLVDTASTSPRTIMARADTGDVEVLSTAGR